MQEVFRLLGIIAVNGAEEANRDIERVGNSSDNLYKSFEKGIEKVGKWAIAIGTATATAATAIGTMALKSQEDLTQAMNDFQASTGTATESLAGYEEALKSIYKNNYGKSYEDIAAAMAEVKQQAGDIGAEELEKMTKDALVLRDTFDFEVNETMRASQMLMDQFGLSSEEAFELIAQGAQNGLDKNGDLLDSINEYSVHYKQLGYDAEDFFNSLANGTEAGTFSVDKLGDAMKEFGIRVKDESDTTMAAFEQLGFSSEDLTRKFAEGGESAVQATDEVIQELFSMDDKVKQNQIGVALFGTMWEDLGADGVKALTDVNGSIDKTKTSLQEIDKVKYNNLTSRLETLKRKFEINAIQPLGEKLKPIAEKFISTLEKKMPQIEKLFESVGDLAIDIFDKLEPGIEWLIDDAFPVLVEILGFVVDHFWELVAVAGAVFTALKAMTIINTVSTALQGATTAFGAFNAVMSANPIGMVVSLLGGLAIAIGGVVASQQEEETQLDKTKEKIKESQEAREAELEAIREKNEAIEEKAVNELTEVANTEKLWKELQTLCDETGKVKDADKARADFILNELNEALGTEYDLNNLNKETMAEMSEEVYKLIEAKKAEILMSAQEEKYAEAINKMAESRNALTEAGIDLSNKKNAVLEAEAELAEYMTDYNEKMSEAEYDLEIAKARGYIGDIRRANARKVLLNNEKREFEEKVEIEKAYLEEAQDTYDQKQQILNGYIEDVADYETAQTYLLEGNTAKAIESLDSMARHYQTASDLADKSAEEQKEILKQQVVEAEIQVKQLEELMANASEEMKVVYERELEAQKSFAEKCKTEYYNAGGEWIEASADGASDSAYVLDNTLNNTINTTYSNMSSKAAMFEKIGSGIIAGIGAGISKNVSTALTAATDAMALTLKITQKAAEIHSPSRLFAREVGAYIPAGIGEGIEENVDDATGPVEGIVEQMATTGSQTSRNINVSSSTSFESNNAQIIEKLNQLIEVMTQQKIYLNSDVLVGELAPAMDASLGNMYSLKGRGQ